eukprot:TRINITY_DN29080_c0_g1_i1.p1 TRINITY_DN29080_c0_g1~~TRINITY_DN29080_c0_g1_i1.p1  ORF type:complete len:296 (+),score=81.25 TRINITY_DN29080_c0_g1_i1:128-1015(+)
MCIRDSINAEYGEPHRPHGCVMSDSDFSPEAKRSVGKNPPATKPNPKRKTGNGAKPPASKRKKAEPKKTSAAPKASEPEVEEQLRRKGVATTAGIIASQIPSRDHGGLQKSKALLPLDGMDLIKKGGERKTKHLFVLPFTLAPKAAGTVGRLAKMDSLNPIMYLEFPSGRLKLEGTIVHPQSKLILVKPKAGQALCDKVFESMIVFGAATWVGTAEENPTERALPIPDDIKQVQQPVQTELDFTKGAATKGEEALEGGAPAESNRRSSGRMTKSVSYIEKDEGDLGSESSSSSDH